MQLSFIGHDNRGSVSISHWNYARSYSPSYSDSLGNFREAVSRSHHLSAEDVRGQITITQVEPSFIPTVAQELVQAMECIGFDSPAGERINRSRQGISYNVEIGSNIETEEFDVVSGIDDY